MLITPIGFRKTVFGVPPAPPGEFSPLDIGGLQVWLDASDIDTLFQDSGATAPVTTNGDPVGLWQDKSGNGNSPGTDTGTFKPSYVTNFQNSLPGIDFDGTNEILFFSGDSLNMMRDVGYGYVFVVANSDETSSGAKKLIYWSTSTAFSSDRLQLVSGAGTANRIRAGGRRLDADSFVATESDTDHGTNTRLWSVRSLWQDSDLFVYQDGALVASETSFQTEGNTSDTASVTFRIGGRTGDVNDQKWNGKVCEVLVYTSELTEQEIDRVEEYLAEKWDISI